MYERLEPLYYRFNSRMQSPTHYSRVTFQNVAQDICSLTLDAFPRV